ncbi:MAG: RNase adapter RapZ, partial [Burkholderiales bacterium]
SVALKVLEDAGYYCIDNLPVNFLPEVVRCLRDAHYHNLAISVDVRGGPSIEALPQQIDAIRADGIDVRLMFLEAKVDTLVKRFSETRRRHPLSHDKLTVTEAITQEREMLGRVGDLGHRIDTSELNANALRNWVKAFVEMDRSRITLICQSFGFKHGIPLDADMVFDVRCLPNPYYDVRLRPFTGKDRPVVDFLESQSDVLAMYLDIEAYVARWLPHFINDNRSYLTVAIGCTGGQHRSVYLTERLAQRFADEQQVLIRHREMHA